VTRGERRDFLLDTGAVSALAGDDKLLRSYTRLLDREVVGSLHIPSPVQSESHTGKAKYDALVDRMVNRLSRPGVKVYIPSSVEIDRRAGELRFEAEKVLGEKITGVDAQVVAIAEYRSRLCAVTILTTDTEHIKALVKATGAKNIEVKFPGRR
jgi:hypothetical protein